jgi:P-type E1-E2 ATPase
VFARVSPAQKDRILLALKHRSHVVGFLGDGINDAPALHTADVGISAPAAGTSRATPPTSSSCSATSACCTRGFSPGAAPSGT